MSVLAGEIQFAAQEICVRRVWSPQYYNRYFQFGLVGESYIPIGEVVGLGVGHPSAKAITGFPRVATPIQFPRIRMMNFFSERIPVTFDSPRIGMRFK